MVKYPDVSRRTLLLLCIAGVAGLGFAAFYRSALPDVVITRTTNGFVPSTITIRKGQSVVFTSTVADSFWPASDFHPTHGTYPAFDPKRALEPGESWRFEFSKAGVWNFHDHLFESMRGTIIVTGAPGESTRECLLQTATTSTSQVGDCWSISLIEILQSDGLSAAFDMYSALYADNPSFRGLSCHDAGHLLGAAAYREYAENHQTIERPETSYCGYGFYHGFMETMLIEHGPSQYSLVREYCDALKTDGQLNNPSGACYHGIGHAAFDSIPGDSWGDAAKMVTAALSVCEQVAQEAPERAQCGTGVFNALAVASSDQAYKLSFNATDSMRICRMQPPRYKDGCYREYGIGVIRENRFDREATIRFINTLENADARAAALGAYVGDEVARSINAIDLSAFFALCNSTAPNKQKDSCHRGVLAGLRQAGEPGSEAELMFNYCDLYPRGSARTECFRFSIHQTKHIAADSETFLEQCLAINEPSLESSCR